ncbi:MAG TPA: hypothetical protein VFT77_04655 [Reyranella sp.]|nr:hypothetical protein [Reyranella sp.]
MSSICVFGAGAIGGLMAATMVVPGPINGLSWAIAGISECALSVRTR